MNLTETIKLYPATEQRTLIEAAMEEYIRAVNETVSLAMSGTDIRKFSSKDIPANLPSAMKGQIAQDVRSIVKKTYKACHAAVLKNRSLAKYGKSVRVTAPAVPVVKKPCCYINNQNFKFLDDGTVQFPVIVEGKTKRITVATSATKEQLDILTTEKLGTLRIVRKGNTLMAQVTHDVAEEAEKSHGTIMGVDLGIKCPAVSYCSDGSVKFYGNGRKNKYMRRHFAYLRRKLQKSKHPEAVERINNKEQRIMKDLDHKVSHDIVATAVAHNAKVIKLEQLTNIRQTTRTSRKNNHSLHTWSFYRLAMYIEYKAKLAGIKVLYVNPAFTSQKCPMCGHVHHADDRDYRCECGYHTHRDLLGALNICASTEYVGDSNIRRAA